MKICPKCGAENKFDGAAFCRECGAELGKTDPNAITTGPSQNNDLESGKGEAFAAPELQIQEPNELSDSNSTDQEGISSGTFEDHTDQLEGFDEPILGTQNHDIDHSSSQFATTESDPSEIDLQSESPADESEQADPVDRPSDGAEAFMAKAEIELPDGDPEDVTEKSNTELFAKDESVDSEYDEPTVKSEPATSKPLSPEMGAVESEEKDKLIASLQSRIPSLANKADDPPEPKTPHGHSLKPGSVIGSTSETENPEPDKQEFSADIDSPTAGPSEFEQEDDLTQTENRYKAPGDHIPRNRGTAHFRRSKIKLPKGVKLKSGDELTVNGRPFVLRPGGRDLATVLLYGTLAVVLVLLVVSQTVRHTGGLSEMPAIGVVTDQNSGRVLADVKVTITELGRSVTTNDAGIFVFDLLPSGSYTLTAKTPFYKTAGMTFDHAGNMRSVVPVEMSESTLAGTDGSELKKTESGKEEKKIQYGDLKVITNIENSEIFIDNRSYGKGGRTIRNVYPGRHKLVIKADGYETYSKTVRVNENGLTTIDAQLARIESDKPIEMSPEQCIAAGQSAFDAGDFRKAVESYTLALLKEKNADCYYMRGQAYLKGNRPADARKDFFQAGKIYMSDGKVTSAISAYTGALDLDPSNMMILRARGYAYIQNGVYDRALADFEQACEINDESYLNLLGRGDAYSAMGEYKDAIKYYKKAEKYTHNKANVYALIALANLARGDEGDARKYYEKFIEEATPEIEQKYAVDPEWQRLKQVALND